VQDRYAHRDSTRPAGRVPLPAGADLSVLRFDGQGLLPCIVQEWTTGSVLMLAYMDREAVERTLSTGTTWFWSRSRRSLWNKGETSGHVQHLRQLLYDCDGDTVLALVEQVGVACHTGTPTCFSGRRLAGEEASPLFAAAADLAAIIAERRRTAPEGSYTARLFAGGPQTIGAKVEEEAAEVAEAALSGDRRHTLYEAGDLVYHLLVLLAGAGIELPDLWWELERRKG